MITLGVYLVGSGLTAITPAGGKWFLFLYATRVIAGMGIGGEYAAINSAIDEMIPAKYRGRVDLAVNGTYWAGALIGTVVDALLLNNLAPDIELAARLRGRPGAGTGHHLRPAAPAGEPALADHARPGGSGREPRSPRSRATSPPPRASCRRSPDDRAIEIQPTKQIGYLALLRVLFRHYPSRAIYGGVLMITQSFLYNAIFFTYGLVLEFFFHVKPNDTPYYFLAFAVGQPARPADHRPPVRHHRPPRR